MTKLISLTAALALAVSFAGCEMDNMLTHRQDIPRAKLGLNALTALPEETAPSRPRIDTVDSLLKEEDAVVGTYEFTTPANVTQVKSASPDFNQYALYFGQPAPNDKPFVTITIGPNVVPQSAFGDGDLKAEKSRVYSLNGLYTQEWTGRSAAGLPFCELIVVHGERGDKLHALAIARDAESRKIALDILGTIKWTPKQ